MILSQEFKKVKRTGFIPTFLVGGLLAAAFPVLNTAVRSENYLGLPDTPLQILLDANWPMMALLNVLLIVGGACLMYYTEYADNAIQKMKSLPLKESTMFFGKAVLLSIDRKSTRLNSSHVANSYAVFCLKKKNIYLRHKISLPIFVKYYRLAKNMLR